MKNYFIMTTVGLIAMGLGPEARGLPSPYVWQQQSSLSVTPPPDYSAMAYDSASQLTILSPYSSTNWDTWLWDGSAWTDVVASGTFPSNSVAMVFDSARSVDVLFSYDYSGTSLTPGETWEWNGSHWSLVSTNGLRNRNNVAMAYDSNRHRTVAFGGNFFLDGPQPAWTWEWDGATWKVVATNGPARRVACAMAYDAKHKNCVLFGGRSGIGSQDPLLGDTWTWDGANWTLSANTGPSPREGFMMAYDSVRQRAILFGGADNGRGDGFLGLGDLWDWDGTQWTLLDTSGPARYSAQMAYDQARQQAVLYGGMRRDPPYGQLVDFQDTWLLHLRDIWVDYAWGGAETGDFSTPFRSLAHALNAVGPNCVLKFKPGTGVERTTFTKSAMLHAPLGPVHIH